MMLASCGGNLGTEVTDSSAINDMLSNVATKSEDVKNFKFVVDINGTAYDEEAKKNVTSKSHTVYERNEDEEVHCKTESEKDKEKQDIDYYVVKNTDSSTVARMLVVPFSDYYHQQTPKNTYRESRSVRDDLGHDLMTDEYEGWLADVQFVLQCEQFYLSQLPTGRRIEPPMDNVRRRQQRASLGKTFEAWASDYFAPGSPNLDVKLVQANVVTDYLSETGQHSVNKGIFTQKLKAYCEYADHIDCYNPKDVTGNMEDGERWRCRDNGKVTQYIYVRSLQACHCDSVPAEILLPF